MAKHNASLTPELLHELFSYDPETGCFTRKKTSNPKRWPIGSVCGWVSGCGYRVLNVRGRHVYEHRAAFLMTHGYLPEAIDHVDRNPLNNRIDNLRASNKSLNGANRPKQANNTSGHKGVTKHWRKWIAQIHVGGKNRYLGIYDTPEQAHAAYVKAARAEYGEHHHK